jgi:hypothetical protein
VDEVEEGCDDLTTEVDVVAAVVVEEEKVVEVVEGGKTSPFLRGRGRTGLGALPTNFPDPGKEMVEAVDDAAVGAAAAVATAAIATRNLAALT